MMLSFLWRTGQLMVAGRQGGQKLWDFAARCIPDWTPQTRLSEPAIVHWAAEISLRALGVAPAGNINHHFVAGKYPNLGAALQVLEKRDRIMPLRVRDSDRTWPGTWYVHSDDLALLDRIEGGDWSPRTTLLSPFDNLIRDRARTRLMFGFDFKIEIYVPALERQYGYYVMPVLHEDRLVARVDPAFDRKAKRLSIRAISMEPGCDVWPARRKTRLPSSLRSSARAGLTTTAACRHAGGAPSVPDCLRTDVSRKGGGSFDVVPGWSEVGTTRLCRQGRGWSSI
jgi:uncharacterized protein YcaQ